MHPVEPLAYHLCDRIFCDQAALIADKFRDKDVDRELDASDKEMAPEGAPAPTSSWWGTIMFMNQ